jgi:hypothetical protein
MSTVGRIVRVSTCIFCRKGTLLFHFVYVGAIVCMCVCVCVWLCVWAYVYCACVCVCMYVFVCTYVFVHLYVHTSILSNCRFKYLSNCEGGYGGKSIVFSSFMTSSFLSFCQILYAPSAAFDIVLINLFPCQHVTSWLWKEVGHIWCYCCRRHWCCFCCCCWCCCCCCCCCCSSSFCFCSCCCRCCLCCCLVFGIACIFDAQVGSL